MSHAVALPGEGHEARSVGLPIFISLALLLPTFIDAVRTTLGVPLLTTAAVTVCLAVWLARRLAWGSLALPYTPVFWMLLCLAALAFLSITYPIGSAVGKLYRATSFVYSRLLIVFLVIAVLRTTRQVRHAVHAAIGLATLSAPIALWQFWMYEATGINYSFAEGEQTFRITADGPVLRGSALATDPNEIGNIMAVGAVLMLSLGLSRERLSGVARTLHYAVAILLAAGVVVTFSRSALAALIVNFCLLAVVLPVAARPCPVRRVVGLWAILAAGAMTGIGLMPSLFGESSQDVLWRAELNQLGLQAMLGSPLTGVGMDSFVEYDNPHDLPPHNLFVQVAAEMGLPALIVVVVLIGGQVVRLVRAVATTAENEPRALFLALALGWAVTLITRMSNPFLTSVFFWFYVGLVEAALIAPRVTTIPPRLGVDSRDG